MSFFDNTRKPKGLGGNIMLNAMNFGHRALADWGLGFLRLPREARVLDCGCGGGANIKKLLKLCPDGVVKGIDYSPTSVEKSSEVNQKAISEGRCVILKESVDDMMFASSWFDFATAFETVYFWPDPLRGFIEINRVLKPGGTLLVCNECGGDDRKDEKWTEKISGMTIYKDAELVSFLKQAKFQNIQIHKNPKGWLCITAEK